MRVAWMLPSAPGRPLTSTMSPTCTPASDAGLMSSSNEVSARPPPSARARPGSARLYRSPHRAFDVAAEVPSHRRRRHRRHRRDDRGPTTSPTCRLASCPLALSMLTRHRRPGTAALQVHAAGAESGNGSHGHGRLGGRRWRWRTAAAAVARTAAAGCNERRSRHAGEYRRRKTARAVVRKNIERQFIGTSRRDQYDRVGWVAFGVHAVQARSVANLQQERCLYSAERRQFPQS